MLIQACISTGTQPQASYRLAQAVPCMHAQMQMLSWKEEEEETYNGDDYPIESW